MTQSNWKREIGSEPTERSWKSLYRAGGAAALLAVLIFVVDIVISFGGDDFHPVALGAVDWFHLLQENPLFGLRALGLLNILSLTISTALYLALFGAHRQVSPAYAALALVMFLLGAAIYIANNASVLMLALSEKYWAASSEAQRAVVAAAGEAALVRGADFTPGSFVGFFFTEAAALIFSIVMLRSGIFSRTNAWLGIIGFSLMIVFTIWTTFIPVLFELAMLIATAGGLTSTAWYILTARRLVQLGKAASRSESQAGAWIAEKV